MIKHRIHAAQHAITRMAIVSLLLTAAIVGLATSPAHAVTTYYHADASQSWASAYPTGITANVGVHNPTVTSGEHSIAEIAATSNTGSDNTVEIGWRKVNGDTAPRIFVFWWKTGNPCNYNTGAGSAGCGSPATTFVECNGAPGSNTCSQSTDVWDVNDLLTSGTTMKFGLQYIGTGTKGWWAYAYLNTGTAEYLGYWPESLWGTGVFVTSPRIMAYGEVATVNASPGSMMGNGTCGGDAGAAQIGSVLGVGKSSGDMNLSYTATDPSKYEILGLSTRTFAYGGDTSC